MYSTLKESVIFIYQLCKHLGTVYHYHNEDTIIWHLNDKGDNYITDKKSITKTRFCIYTRWCKVPGLTHFPRSDQITMTVLSPPPVSISVFLLCICSFSHQNQTVSLMCLFFLSFFTMKVEWAINYLK